jgi:diguanylate cyclase (GGDEF)-like protein
VNASGTVDVRLFDRLSNVYSTKIFLNNENNPVVKCLKENKIVNTNDVNFLNINYLQNTAALILPINSKDGCKGVFIVGLAVPNPHNNKILNILVDHMCLYISNLKLLEKVQCTDNKDPLTSLKTHRAYQEALRLELSKAEEENTPLSIVILDIQDIANINREFGHLRGDEIIKTVAKIVDNIVSDKGITGRYGGDELAIILPNHDNIQAGYLVEYIHYSLSCCLIDDVGAIKASFGISTYPTCSNNQEKLLIQAEQAMTMAKHKFAQDGKSNIVSAQDIDFWSDAALDSFAAVITKKHSQLGINFEDELVDKFHKESLGSNAYLVEMITSLAGAIDAKDTYTKGHSMSVSRYSEALAKALELPHEEVERIKLGALLHDVGKIGIPESVLKSLTDSV